MFPSEIRRKIKFLLSSGDDREFRRKLKILLGTYPVDTDYYRRAFTHRSAARNKTEHNERLEYLGDAVISAIVAEYLYKKYPSNEEGSLTKMRSKLVNRLSLLRMGKDLNLDGFIVAHINAEIEGKYILSNAVEALVGAVYLDLGYRYARHFVLDILFVNELTKDIEHLEYDFKSKVLEWGQKHKQTVLFESIQKGNASFFSKILIDGTVVSDGTGYSKKESEQNAANKIWEKLKVNG